MKKEEIDRIAEAIAAKLGEPASPAILGCGDASSTQNYRACKTQNYDCGTYECGGAGNFDCSSAGYRFDCYTTFTCFSNFDCEAMFYCSGNYN